MSHWVENKVSQDDVIVGKELSANTKVFLKGR